MNQLILSISTLVVGAQPPVNEVADIAAISRICPTCLVVLKNSAPHLKFRAARSDRRTIKARSAAGAASHGERWRQWPPRHR